jgi:Nucleotidyltransferase domain
MTPTQLVHHLFKTQYARSNCIFFCGSAARNEMTEHSDVDIIVLFDKLPYAYRETYLSEGWLVDAQIHDPETLNYLMASDARLGSAIVAKMITESILIPIATRESDLVSSVASKIVTSGPSPQDFSGVRYMVANMISDLRQSEDRHETLSTGVELYKILSNFVFRSRNQWAVSRKMTPRLLEALDPAINEKFFLAFSELFSEGKVDAAINLAEELLEVVGGPLSDGFKMSYSPQARLRIAAPLKATTSQAA